MEKAPYRLTFKFTSARPDAVGEALAQLKAFMAEYAQSGDSSATITIEGFRETPLNAIREDFEIWLHSYKIGLDCEVTMKAPGLRPETITALRANHETPMDRILTFAERNNADVETR